MTRAEMGVAIVEFLKDNSTCPYRYFDCGELGHLRVFRIMGQWFTEWIQVVPVDDPLGLIEHKAL